MKYVYFKPNTPLTREVGAVMSTQDATVCWVVFGVVYLFSQPYTFISSDARRII